MIQRQNDKKEQIKEFKLKSLMIDFDEYIKISKSAGTVGLVEKEEME